MTTNVGRVIATGVILNPPIASNKEKKKTSLDCYCTTKARYIAIHLRVQAFLDRLLHTGDSHDCVVTSRCGSITTVDIAVVRTITGSIRTARTKS